MFFPYAGCISQYPISVLVPPMPPVSGHRAITEIDLDLSKQPSGPRGKILPGPWEWDLAEVLRIDGRIGGIPSGKLSHSYGLSMTGWWFQPL